MTTNTPIHEVVREHYAERIKNSASCCDASDCCSPNNSLYPEHLLTTLPSDVARPAMVVVTQSRWRHCNPDRLSLISAPAQDSIACWPCKKSVQMDV